MSQKAMSRPIEVWACPWLLLSRRLGFYRRCGYVQNGPGCCPYDHVAEQEGVFEGPGVELVKVGTLDWPENGAPTWRES